MVHAKEQHSNGNWFQLGLVSHHECIIAFVGTSCHRVALFNSKYNYVILVSDILFHPDEYRKVF